MSKFFKLKEWVTLTAAAQHLSSVFEEEVTVADVLRLGLDEHLQLSINFVNKVRARRGRSVPISEARLVAFSKTNGEISGPVDIPEIRVSDELPINIRESVDLGSIVLMVRGIDIGNDQVLELTEEIKTLEGIWNLPMIGAERLDVEHMYQNETGGPEVTLIYLNGAFVANPSGEIYQLQEQYKREHSDFGRNGIASNGTATASAETTVKKTISLDDPNSYYPAPGVPQDSVIVVRTSALADLENRLADNAIDRPVAVRERATLLTIIAALAQLAKVDWTKPSKAGDVIEGLSVDINARVPSRTIQEHLKRIPDALERRSND